MFQLFVYVVAVLFVLVLISPSQQAIAQTAAEPATEDEFADNDYAHLVDQAIGEEDPAVFELADQLEVIYTGGLRSKCREDWATVDDRQVRSLCRLYGLPCNKRGRVAAVHIQRLRLELSAA